MGLYAPDPDKRRKLSCEARRASEPGMGVPGSGLPECERKGKAEGGARAGAIGGVSNGLRPAASAGVTDDERLRWWFRARTLPAAAAAVAAVAAVTPASVLLRRGRAAEEASGPVVETPMPLVGELA